MAWFLDDRGNNRNVNDPETQCDICFKYYIGEGVTLVYSKAVKWFRMAADQGDIRIINVGLVVASAGNFCSNHFAT